VDHFHIANSYGLFRRMTGVDYRSEVIEGSYCIEGPWEEHEFVYISENVNNSLLFTGEIFSHIHISNVSF